MTQQRDELRETCEHLAWGPRFDDRSIGPLRNECRICLHCGAKSITYDGRSWINPTSVYALEAERTQKA